MLNENYLELNIKTEIDLEGNLYQLVYMIYFVITNKFSDFQNLSAS